MNSGQTDECVCGAAMSNDKSLSQIWSEKAAERWRTDFDDLNREQGGVQFNKLHRFIGPNSAFIGNPDKKKGDDEAVHQFSEIIQDTQERLSRQFQQFYTEAREFYRSGLDKIDEMENELGALEAEYERRTIRLSDGRRVYVDESGNYIYQDAAGNWQALEDAAIPEAKAQHEKLGAAAITGKQKDDLDDLRHNMASTKDRMIRNNEELDALEEKREAGKLTEEEYKRAQERQQQDQSALDSLMDQKEKLKSDLKASGEIEAYHDETTELYSGLGNSAFDDDSNYQDTKRTVSASGSALEGAGQLTDAFASASNGAPVDQPAITQPAPAVNKPAGTNPGIAG